MKVAEFDFPLPAAAIAQRPAVPRDSARLLEVGAALNDRIVSALPQLLRPGDLMVFNDTKVIPARLHGRSNGLPIEITLIKEIAPGRWRALARRARRLKPGQRVDLAEGFSAKVEAKSADGVDLAFDRAGADLREALERHGTPPLPPYIKRGAPDPRDRADYQTVFAARPGAIAAPTAGLHFTEQLLARLDERRVRRATLTLHVGAGTFSPVKAEAVEDHVMHAEWGEIGVETAEAIRSARANGARVIAVGTTALRLIETAAAEGGEVRPFMGETDIFITPGFRFRAVDMLMTNFHLPCSTLFMLVCAFAGTERMKRAYAHALAAGYRFYSYGDGCLLHRGESG